VVPDVTIVMSFKDPGRYFDLALRSIFAQTLENWELILIDDGSDDGSLRFAQSLRDPRVRVFSDGICRRLHVRRNQGIALANAPYIALMDADDIMHPRRLETQFVELERQRRAVVLGSTAFSIDEDNNLLGLRRPRARWRPGNYECRSAFLNPTVAAPTSWFRANPYSEDPVFYRSEDAELWCRTSRDTDFVNLEDPLMFYREQRRINLANYLGSSMGLCVLLQRKYAKPHYHFVKLWSVEIAKVWIAITAEAFGVSDILVKRRSQPIGPAARAEALRILSQIHHVELPLPSSEAISTSGPSQHLPPEIVRP
jgi:glycosyltransferase involved in cell wall biosynthesis